MSNDLLEVQLLWSQTIAQVVTAVEMTELMALWEWEANGLNHGSGSLIKYQEPAMNNMFISSMFSLVNINLSCSFLCVPHYLVIMSWACPFLWQFECQSLEFSAVGLLCVILPVMLSFEHCIEKKVYFAWCTMHQFCPVCYLPHSFPPSTLSFSSLSFFFPHYAPTPLLPSHPLPLPRSPTPPPPCLSLLRTDLLSLHWWPWWFSWMVHSLPGASPRPFSAACSCSSTQQRQQPRSFLCEYNDSMAPATQHRDLLILSHRLQGFVFQCVLSLTKTLQV